MNQDYRETMKILSAAGYELDKDMDASLWETKYHMFERIPQDGSVNEPGLVRVIEEEKASGKLPLSFQWNDVVADRFVVAAAASVNQRFGSGCE